MVQRIKGLQQRSAGTREAILAAVARLWRDRSFDDITIADIAAEAGIAKGSVLAHFSEKLAILAGFLAQALDDTSQALSADPGFADTPGHLAQSLDPLFAYLLADRALLRLLTLDGDGAQCTAILDPAVARLRAALVAGFARAGHGDPVLDADVLMALAVQVAVAGHVRTSAEAVAALERLAGIVYRKDKGTAPSPAFD